MYCLSDKQRGPKHRIWVHSSVKPPHCRFLGLFTRTWCLLGHMPCHLHTFTLPSGPHLFQRQQHELLCLGHLHEVLEDILVRRLEEVAAGVRVSKTPDPQAVGWVQLAEQELAASVPHTIELKQAGSREKCLAVEKNWGGKESFQGKETIFTLVSPQVNHRTGSQSTSRHTSA